MTERTDLYAWGPPHFVQERDWARFQDPKNLSMAVASEAGEITALLRWVRNDEADAAEIVQGRADRPKRQSP